MSSETSIMAYTFENIHDTLQYIVKTIVDVPSSQIKDCYLDLWNQVEKISNGKNPTQMSAYHLINSNLNRKKYIMEMVRRAQQYSDRVKQLNVMADYVVKNCPGFIKETPMPVGTTRDEHTRNQFIKNHDLKINNWTVLQAGFIAMFCVDLYPTRNAETAAQGKFMQYFALLAIVLYMCTPTYYWILRTIALTTIVWCGLGSLYSYWIAKGNPINQIPWSDCVLDVIMYCGSWILITITTWIFAYYVIGSIISVILVSIPPIFGGISILLV